MTDRSGRMIRKRVGKLTFQALPFIRHFSSVWHLSSFWRRARLETSMGPVRIRHSSHDFGWQSSHSVDLAGWQAKMASIELWIHDVMHTSPISAPAFSHSTGPYTSPQRTTLICKLMKTRSLPKVTLTCSVFKTQTVPTMQAYRRCSAT